MLLQNKYNISLPWRLPTKTPTHFSDIKIISYNVLYHGLHADVLVNNYVLC